MTARATIPPGVLFVTGGARGLGHAIALAFAREGCTGVAVVDVLPDNELKGAEAAVVELGAQCIALRCDVTDEAQVQQAIKATVDKFGRIDFAVNAAGIIAGVGLTADIDVAGYEKCLKVNTIGVLQSMKHEIAQMIKQEPATFSEGRSVPQRGAVVNIASVNSIQSGSRTSAYSASKHAVVGMSKAAALDHRHQNIRVNSLSPGFIRTAIVTENATSDIAEIWKSYEGRQGRAVFPEEIADAAVLLCSPKMSIVNAHNLVCDNGFTMNENTF